MKQQTVQIKKLSEDAIIPAYQTKGAAGFDLHSIEDVTILAGQTLLVKTGLSMKIPEGYEMQIRPRSGLALKHGVTVWNSPGTVDSDYTGEISVILANAGKTYTVRIGDRIAQGVIAQVESAKFEVVEELVETERGSKGFGSSGV